MWLTPTSDAWACSAKWHAAPWSPGRVAERRIDRPALLGLSEALVEPAAGVEAAAGRRVHRARHVACQDDALALALRHRVRDGHRREQRARVRVAAGWRTSRRAARSRRSCRGTSPPTRSLMCLTTDRSWAMNRYVSPSCSRRSVSRLRTCAWIDTSSAEIGSSQTMNSGSTARARATPMRCRWPPENSCG